MMYKFIFITLLGVVTTASFCFGQKNKEVTIKVYAIGGKGQNAVITMANMLSTGPDTLAFMKLDSNGKGKLNFTLLKPSFASFQIGRQYVSLYLYPEDDLQLTINYAAPAGFQFKGKGAAIANYLGRKSLITSKFNRSGGKYFFELSSEDFLKRLDSLRVAYREFHRSYTDSSKIPETLSALMVKQNEIELFGLIQSHALDNYRGKRIQEIPESFRDINDKTPFDADLLEARSFWYAIVLNEFIKGKLDSLWKGKTKEEIAFINNKWPVLAEKKIKAENYPGPFKEFFLARNVDKELALRGPTPVTDSIFNNFTEEFPSSGYLQLLEKRYTKWLALSKGNPAPDFTGTTPDGKKISLSDLKGKVVYIDIWATWCGPCIAEFRFTKQLKDQFKGNDQLIFLYVSIDQKLDAWRKFLNKHPQLQGLHLNLTDQEYAAFKKSYQAYGVPQYILVDSEGNIVKVKAPRPSSGLVANEIKKLLTP